MNIYKIDVRVSEDTKNKFKQLTEHYNINNTKLLEKIINDTYIRELIQDTVSPNVRKDCVTHMCKIVNAANGITDSDIRKEILEEVNTVCQILK
jgi:hypothetical protein